MKEQTMTVMTEEWVSFWYQCLNGNADYSEYCDARRTGDEVTRKQLELKFELLAEIYNDFGDITDGFDRGLAGDDWNNWFPSHRHLFMQDIRQITDPTTHVISKGHLLISVPLAASQVETENNLHQFFTNYYAENEAVVEPPKYQLYLTNGKTVLGYEAVRQACIAGSNCYLYPLDQDDVRDYLSYKEVVANFIKHEVDNLGWGLGQKEKDELNRTGLLSENRFESFKVRINRCRRDFEMLARNTIRGRFPDTSDFDSRTIDHFKR